MGYHPEPITITAGDSLGWTRGYDICIYRDSSNTDQFAKASTWTLTYYFAGPNGQFKIIAAATVDDYIVNVAASITEKYTTGHYDWAAYVAQTTSRYQIDSGRIEVKANLARQQTGYDGRSHVRKVLEAIKAVIEGRASADQTAYSIGGRSISKIPIPDLLMFYSQYKWQVDKEEAAERIDNQMEGTGRILVRFGST